MINDNTQSVVAKCPVCNGTGKVPFGFYDAPYVNYTSFSWGEVCRSCLGKGIIWNK